MGAIGTGEPRAALCGEASPAGPAASRAAAASADLRAALAAAAAAIHGADALFVAAGAGMSADSGLPHFHGTDTERLWEAFPALRAKGLCLQARDDSSSEIAEG